MHPANALQRTNEASGVIWSLDTRALPPGFFEYRYHLKFQGGLEREVADPCARYGGTDPVLPSSGVVVGKGAVRTVTPLAGRKPLRDLVIYELNVDDFTADFRGASAPLDAIHRLDLGSQLIGTGNAAWTDLLPLEGPVDVQVQGNWLRNWKVASNWGCVFFQQS